MPAHKGKRLLGFEKYDITEIDGADNLFLPSGIIKESQRNASDIFNANTFYSTEGSSLSIRAMLFSALKATKATDGQRPYVLAGRNAHKSFISVLGLLDLDVKWIYPEQTESYLSCTITANKLRQILLSLVQMPIAVYVTTPDYLGNTVDVKELSLVCKEFGVLLLVDNAHGAYLKFLEPSLHPIDLGADMCCDSAHKTLPSLTGAGYLHLSKNLPSTVINQVQRALSIFASTSPSYLILQSLDATNEYLSKEYKKRLKLFIEKLNGVKSQLVANGFSLIGNEPLKLTINAKKYGYSGYEINEILKKHDIYIEFYDQDYIVALFSPEIKDCELKKFKDILISIRQKNEKEAFSFSFSKFEKATTIRKALLADTEIIDVDQANGRIFADLSTACPPAVCILICGEIIDKNAIERLKYYGTRKVQVLK